MPTVKYVQYAPPTVIYTRSHAQRPRHISLFRQHRKHEEAKPMWGELSSVQGTQRPGQGTSEGTCRERPELQRGTATGLPQGHSNASFGYGGSRAENEEQAAVRCCYLGARGEQGRVRAVERLLPAGAATRCVSGQRAVGRQAGTDEHPGTAKGPPSTTASCTCHHGVSTPCF